MGVAAVFGPKPRQRIQVAREGETVDITIPPIGYPGLAFLGFHFVFCLIMWGLGEVLGVSMILGLPVSQDGALPWWERVFGVLWLVGWTAGGAQGARLLLGLFLSTDRITFTPEQMTITGGLFGRPRSFVLREVEELERWGTRWQGFRSAHYGAFGPTAGWTVSFEYRSRLHHFGQWLHEADAEEIIKVIRGV